MPYASLIAILLRFAAADVPSDEVGVLRRDAEELLRQGRPAKALVLLQRARGLDSMQRDIDQLMDECRVRMGSWVAPDAGAGWNDPEDAVRHGVESNPDSMFRVGLKLVDAENLSGALRIFQALVRARNPSQAQLAAFADLKARQEQMVALHLGLAERAAELGAIEESLEELRVAYSVRPEDPVLRARVEAAERSVRISREGFRRTVAEFVSAGDADGATRVLAKARRAHPSDTAFRHTGDSLAAARGAFVARRLEEIAALADSGRSGEALASMDALRRSFPSDAGIAQAQAALQERIIGKKASLAGVGLAREFDHVLEQGDQAAARQVLSRLKGSGVPGEKLDTLISRLDSANAGAQLEVRFGSAFQAARRALAKRDTAGARMQAQRAQAARPGNPLAKGILSGLAESRKAPPAARRSPVASRDDQSRKVRGLVAAGVASYRSGDYRAAMERWKEALSIDPGCVQAERYIANVGRKQEALQ